MGKREDIVYQLPFRLRILSSAKVAQSPCGISEHAQFVIFAQERQQGSQSALLQNVVSALRTVACDVPERPDGLFADIQHGR